MTKRGWLTVLILTSSACNQQYEHWLGPCQGDEPIGECTLGVPDVREPQEPTCVEVATAPELVVPTVQLLIDQSGSMNEPFGGPTRWEAVQAALVDLEVGVVTQLHDRVAFGATLYSGPSGANGGTCPNLLEATPALNNVDAIAELVLGNEPERNTPTGDAVAAVAAAFPQVDGPRIIVLATDGDPDTCDDPDAHDRAAQERAESAVEAAHAQGIDTYVLSVGDDVSVPHLQRLANAGKSQPQDTGEEPFYIATDPEELVGAFEDIVQNARTCLFTLDLAVDDPTLGRVSLDGVELRYGEEWILVDPTSLELLGEACTAYLDGDAVELSAELDCVVTE